MKPYETARCGKPRSPEWYAARRLGIGSSEAASVLGFGRWKHALEVWLDKTGREEPRDYDNPQMAVGRALEEVVGRLWAEQQGRYVVRPPTLLRSRRWPCIQASLDFIEVESRRARKPLAPVEVKVVSNDWDDWRDGVPDYYTAQVLTQLIVLDLDLGYVAALINGAVRSFEVRADAALREDTAAALFAWWRKHVVNDERPPLDDVLDRALLARICPTPEDNALDIDGREEIAALIRLHDDLTVVKGEAKHEWDEATNRLAVLMADHDSLVWKRGDPVAWRRGARVYTRPDRLPATAGLLLEDAS